ncbi:CCA tRNA nucleotidyltransferase [Carboxydochorda subterranea]|uniref:CCA tRNA nucleotidyltransferase n=1 Tax=Carboxydichorda subterranea TaxID=3109565 RepID=A0ABZ1BWK7_9FIRM|nr:CCA tRNA nucleotidyltransferase [Limnochorda sp. L945t]WRP17187.1 CCA tRNA nucleotidyltransferase [Limnochorda sp. L945t]
MLLHRPGPGLTWQGVPEDLRAIARRLTSAGYRVWLVGGSLRDLLRGESPVDWDLATEAVPQEVLRLLPGSRPTGARFGTVTATQGAVTAEITTLRGEGPYSDFRHPDEVTLAGSIEEDLGRRDFTINAMALPFPEDPAVSSQLIDPFGGRADLAARVIRAVGHPPARFYEDPLRMLRALRLAAQLAFTVEPATARAIRAAAPLLGYVPRERIRQELERILPGRALYGILRQMDALGLLSQVFPAVAATKGQAQDSRYHARDVFDHTMLAVQWSGEVAGRLGTPGQLAVLYHDVGKPATFSEAGGVIHFFGHEHLSAQLARQDLRTLTFPTSVVDEVAWLVAHHMLDPHIGPRGLRRLRAKAGSRERFVRLMLLRACDVLAHRAPPEPPIPEGAERMLAVIPGLREVLEEPEGHFTLALDGHAIMQAAGIGPGPEVGRLKEALLEWALEDPAGRNTPEQLRKRLEAVIRERGSSPGRPGRRVP